MSEEQKPNSGDPVNFPDAHEGAPGDPRLIGEGLMDFLDNLQQRREPEDVTAARQKLAGLLDTKARGESVVGDDELAQAQKELADALKRAGAPEPPVD